jgi:hypothetical protein
MTFHPSRDDNSYVARPAQHVQYEDVTRSGVSTKHKSSSHAKVHRHPHGGAINAAAVSGVSKERPILTMEMIQTSLDTGQLAAILGIQKKTLQNRLSDTTNPNPNYPRYFTLGVGGEKRFPLAWIDEWLQENIQISDNAPRAKV